MCSFGLAPDQDFDGILLQNLSDLSRVCDLLFVTSFYGGDCGIVAFSWLAENDSTCRPLIESLKAIANEYLTAALMRLFFTHCENFHIAPEWWEGLPERTRGKLVNRFRSTVDLKKAYQRLWMMGCFSPRGEYQTIRSSCRVRRCLIRHNLQFALIRKRDISPCR